MRHHGGESAIGGGHGGQASRTAVRVERVLLGGRTGVVNKAHGGQGFCCMATVFEVGITLAMGHGNGQPATGHALQEQTG